MSKTTGSFTPMDWKQYKLLNFIELTRLAENTVTFGFFVDVRDGVLVMRELRPGSPADSAGLVIGDIIFAVNGKRIATRAELKAETQKATTIRLTVFRKRSEPLDPSTLLPPSEDPHENDQKKDNVYFICRVDLCPLSILGIDITCTKGHIHVDSITSKGVGLAAGLKPNDRILAVNNEPVKDKEDFKNMITAAKGDVVDLLVERSPIDGRAENTLVNSATLVLKDLATSSLATPSPPASIKGVTFPSASSTSPTPGQSGQSLTESIEDLRNTVAGGQNGNRTVRSQIPESVHKMMSAYREQMANRITLNCSQNSTVTATKRTVAPITNIKMTHKAMVESLKKEKPH